MRIRIYKTSAFVLFIIFSNITLAIAQGKTVLENDLYKIAVLKNGNVEISEKRAGTGQLFSPDFTVIYSDKDPGLKTIYNKNVGMIVPSWNSSKVNKRTAGFFDAGDVNILTTDKGVFKDNKIRWHFSSDKGFTLRAELALPPAEGEPVITYHFMAIKPGWYSIGYTGAPETDFRKVNEIWQPFVWQERRFPYMPFLSTENMCPLPAVLVNKNNSTLGVVADPSEIRFRFSTLKTSRFGVILRDVKGDARPMVFSPVFGGADSYLKKNDTASFSIRLVIRNESIFNTYKYIARKIFGFHDYRKNATCSLNETIQNIIGYAMNDFYSGWIPDMKAEDYTTDVPNTVKIVSSLHPLSIAIITDNKQIYERRALPMIEYLLSREKYLFAKDTGIRGQSPSHYLKGPAANVSEVAALYEISKKRTPIFKHYAKDLYGKSRVLNLKKVVRGSTWQNSLALYRMTGNKQYLDSAKAGADKYIAKRIDQIQTDFNDVQIASGERFPTSWTPKWIDLLELFEETKDKKYLNAAKEGAELFINFIWMVPQIPNREIIVNKGDSVGTYAYQNRLFPDTKSMKVPEEKVPAWRLSQIGLMPESTTTYTSNRAIFLDHYAAYLLRLAYYTHSSFFHDIARSAIVGRYANYPGYTITGEYTNVYSRPDYPLRPLNQLTYNNIYYNHVWPQIALLMDYLISDAFTSSNGKINFPSHYAQGYAYLQSKVYGDEKGTFYGDKDVQLWMPAKMLRTNNIQANYIAGYGNGNLYIGLMNQSPDMIKVKVQLNPDVIPFSSQKTYKVRLWKDNQSVGTTTMRHGEINVSLSGEGITSFSIDGLSITPQFQNEILKAGNSLPAQSYLSESTPLGKVIGMIINMGASLSNTYIYLQATETELKEARFHYKDRGNWKEIVDTTYPYEFSVPVLVHDADFEYWIEGTDLKGKTLRTKMMKLKLK